MTPHQHLKIPGTTGGALRMMRVGTETQRWTGPQTEDEALQTVWLRA